MFVFALLQRTCLCPLYAASAEKLSCEKIRWSATWRYTQEKNHMHARIVIRGSYRNAAWTLILSTVTQIDEETIATVLRCMTLYTNILLFLCKMYVPELNVFIILLTGVEKSEENISLVNSAPYISTPRLRKRLENKIVNWILVTIVFCEGSVIQ